ncbi:type II toxin-antitoxin system VapC family toxin [Devosia sp. YIM 151766]|uniref:PIN domain-containing protein n=1 Tax=Devosia sp. YIM 151766 TaxID=3017325 RepID=UPI00255C4292|nr:type II toxin-antitoxin system VapC family toxin [Devosia sp. YIM 151766]WIY52188.1 type II toxin-antitoxin system VapC family toxin [Devosia sp. YIM 151766]
MIGLDTNVLVRVFVEDSSAQTEAALRLLGELSQDDPGYVGIVVLVELAWVLKRSYGFADDAIFAALESLFESANIEIERADLVQEAVLAAHDIGVDIADFLIALTAAEAGARKTMTFDRNAAKRIPGMELLA